MRLLLRRGGCVLAAIVFAAPGLDAQDPAAVSLPAPRLDGPISVERALSERRSSRAYADSALSVGEVGQLLWAAQGETGPADAPPAVLAEWGAGRRTAPSAGARYPLETYLVVGSVTGLEPGLYRYDPPGHALVPLDRSDRRRALAAAALRQASVRDAPAALVLTGVQARLEGRYGGRAERYVVMEAGAAAQNVALQAVALGLGTVLVGAFRDDAVRDALGLPAEEAPLAILPIGRVGQH